MCPAIYSNLNSWDRCPYFWRSRHRGDMGRSSKARRQIAFVAICRSYGTLLASHKSQELIFSIVCFFVATILALRLPVIESRKLRASSVDVHEQEQPLLEDQDWFKIWKFYSSHWACCMEYIWESPLYIRDHYRIEFGWPRGCRIYALHVY